MKLLTEAEAAEILRCSRSKVKRLRLTHKLSFIPGRPALIDEVDLQTYMEEVKSRKAEQVVEKPTKPTRTPEQEQAESMREARLRAERVWMRRQNSLREREQKKKSRGP